MNIEGKQKFLKGIKKKCRKAKIFEGKQKKIFEGKQ